MQITYHDDAKRTVSYEWNNFDEWFAEYKEWVKLPANASLRAAHGYTASQLTGVGGNLSWYGHKDGFDGTLSAIDKGWSELRQSLERKMADVTLDLPVFPSYTMTRKRKRKWMAEGDDYDQQRTWSGDLEHAWCKPVRTERMAPNMRRVTLAFDVSDNASVSNDQAMWRAALSMLLCDSLARAGRTFEVWAIDSTSRPFAGSYVPTLLYSAWMIKGANEPAVMDRLAGMLGVGFMRTVGFMAMGMGPYVPSSGLGSAAHFGLPHTLEQRRKDGEVIIRIAGCHTKQQALVAYADAWREVEKCAEQNDEAA
jgi:hypothetical protein